MCSLELHNQVIYTRTDLRNVNGDNSTCNCASIEAAKSISVNNADII